MAVKNVVTLGFYDVYQIPTLGFTIPAATPISVHIANRGVNIVVQDRSRSMPRYVPPTVMIREPEKKTFRFDFSRLAHVVADPIASAVVTVSPSGPTIGTPSVADDVYVDVTIDFTGMNDGDTFTVTCTATLGSGNKEVGDVYFPMVFP